jgi:hypothetical protein
MTIYIPRCPDCDVPGNGKCAKCLGSGTNLDLKSDRPRCPHCSGSGQCQSCGGTGRPRRDAGTLLSLNLD